MPDKVSLKTIIWFSGLLSLQTKNISKVEIGNKATSEFRNNCEHLTYKNLSSGKLVDIGAVETGMANWIEIIGPH